MDILNSVLGSNTVVYTSFFLTQDTLVCVGLEAVHSTLQYKKCYNPVFTFAHAY